MFEIHDRALSDNHMIPSSLQFVPSSSFDVVPALNQNWV